MKFIENPELARLADLLDHDGPECTVHTRIEPYSCKNVKRDKKLFKSLEVAYNDELSSSLPPPSWLDRDEPEQTPFGPFDKHSNRKTLYLLIACLNVAFPDYDFSDVKHGHFNKEQSGASVLNALSNTLIGAPHRAAGLLRAPRTYSSYPPASSDFFPTSTSAASSPVSYGSPLRSLSTPTNMMAGTHPTLYNTLDRAISLSECEVFSYSPNIESDPHAEDLSSDDDDELNSPHSPTSGSDEDDDYNTFQFDDYDVDEQARSSRDRYRVDIPRTFSPSPVYRRRRGALLWSSHWFFLNRKLKRILYITIWARSKAWASSDDELYAEAGEQEVEVGSLRSNSGGSLRQYSISKEERFTGWEGSVGAGARALGLVSASA